MTPLDVATVAGRTNSVLAVRLGIPVEAAPGRLLFRLGPVVLANPAFTNFVYIGQ